MYYWYAWRNTWHKKIRKFHTRCEWKRRRVRRLTSRRHKSQEQDQRRVFLNSITQEKRSCHWINNTLSKEIAGLILSYDHFWCYLHGQGNTIDTKLEKQNFEFAVRALAKVRSQVYIDGFSTIAEYIDLESSELDDEILLKKDEQSFCVHVRTSQYFTQKGECMDTKCCIKPISIFIIKYIQLV